MAETTFTGRHVTVGALNFKPFSVFPADPNISEDYYGLSFDAFRTIAQRLNWTYNVVTPLDGAPGAPHSNGSWNGLVGMLLKGVSWVLMPLVEIDVAVGPYTITYARSQAIDFTYPFYEDPTGILIPPPRAESKVWACMQPYTTEVWLGLGACLLILPLLLWAILQVSSNGLWISTASYPSLQKQFDFFIAALLSQSGTCFVNTHPSRTLAAAWCLASVILVNVYTSTLVSYLTVPKQKALVDSIDDVATKGLLTFSVMKSTSFDFLMLSATEGSYKLLGDSLRRRPETRLPTVTDGVQKVLTGTYAFIMDKSMLDDEVYEDYKKHPNCRLALAKNSFYKSYVALMIRKNSVYLKRVNLEMIRLHEAGLISYWSSRSLPPPNPCVVIKTGMPQSANLKLSDLQSAFVIYGLGNLLAVVIFAGETLYRFRKSLSCHLAARRNRQARNRES